MQTYGDYFDKWIQGIPDEISFWNKYMKTKGGKAYHKSFEFNTQKNKPFLLEGDIPNGMSKVKFIDVGSGPFSRCGIKTDKVDLDFTAIDPLADAYGVLKEKYGLNNGVEVKAGYVETLSDQFDENTFDLVHMSNSLDHCFDAVFALYQLLYICKVGGKVILHHHENEAENENYQGFHQWNLSLHNDQNSFLIWRKDICFDICDMFSEYVDFVLLADQKGGIGPSDWIYNKIVMKKKKEIAIPENNYLYTMLQRLSMKYVLSMTNNVTKASFLRCFIDR